MEKDTKFKVAEKIYEEMQNIVTIMGADIAAFEPRIIFFEAFTTNEEGKIIPVTDIQAMLLAKMSPDKQPVFSTMITLKETSVENDEWKDIVKKAFPTEEELKQQQQQQQASTEDIDKETMAAMEEKLKELYAEAGINEGEQVEDVEKDEQIEDTREDTNKPK